MDSSENILEMTNNFNNADLPPLYMELDIDFIGYSTSVMLPHGHPYFTEYYNFEQITRYNHNTCKHILTLLISDYALSSYV